MTKPHDPGTPCPRTADAPVRSGLGAGIGSIVLLTALFVASLMRDPDPAYSTVLGTACLVVTVLMIRGARRWRDRC
ncbi:hypothetical protein [Pseudonocardia lacus]|uniref:hypothetical protein n=1 Tax=Pseudonocardia lacus TaxID=2835865 RepID=UPI001BDCD2AD|nr:hypothetical protein [Pseudonocardia lacus]